MKEKYLDLERFLSEAERQVTKTARDLYRDDPALADRFGKLVNEIRSVKGDVIRSVTEATAA